MNFKEAQSAEKLRGGYYTPPEIASYLLRWVMQSTPESLLEPSCGDGVFFRELAQLPHTFLSRVTGFEIEPDEAAKATRAAKDLRANVTVRDEDFLGWSLRELMAGQRFDAIVGNPPFIRYQYLDTRLQDISEKLFDHLRLPFTRHTNLWVPFVAASITLLTPGGRLAMLIPAEILHVLHATGLREYLSQECSRILIVDPQDLWFPDVLQGAVLLLAERRTARNQTRRGVGIVSVTGSSFLRADPQQVFEAAEYANGATASGKWMWALLHERERELLEGIGASETVQTFGAVADVDVGIVTGANKFFLVPDEVVEQYGLGKWAFPMFGRSDHVPGVIYNAAVHKANRRRGLPTNFLWLKFDSKDRVGATVRRYLEEGEAEELHLRYKCRIRTPWYLVPSVYASPVGMLKRCHDYPRLILNELGAYTTDTAYRISNSKVDPISLVGSFVNSLTALSAEMEGRHYGGGVLELVPSEIERLLIPIVKTRRMDLVALDKGVRSSMPSAELLRQQDLRILSQAGLSSGDQHAIHAAWWRLRSRRQRSNEASSTESQG